MSSDEDPGSDLSASATNTSWTKNCAHLGIQASFEPGIVIKYYICECISYSIFYFLFGQQIYIECQAINHGIQASFEPGIIIIIIIIRYTLYV